MPDNQWSYWQADLREPQPRDVVDPGNGYYRNNAAKTKVDFPVAIWSDQDGRHVRIGTMRQIDGETAVLEFLSGSTWHNSRAVSHQEYLGAIANGKWADGKRARSVTVDAPAMVAHLIETGDKDLLLYLRKRAEAATRKGITMPGMNEETE